jgi:hypothetical protein
LFFTSRGVRDSLDKGTRRALSKFGAFTRRTAKSSLKYKIGPAPAGQPPHVHRSAGYTVKKKSKGVTKLQPASPLRELLFFSYDPVNKSVVIGPALGGSRSGAPRTQEEGGTARTPDGRSVTIAARPFMKPAFKSNLAKVMGDFRNIVKG